MWPLSSRGLGGMSLVAGPLKKDFFCGSPKVSLQNQMCFCSFNVTKKLDINYLSLYVDREKETHTHTRSQQIKQRKRNFKRKKNIETEKQKERERDRNTSVATIPIQQRQHYNNNNVRGKISHAPWEFVHFRTGKRSDERRGESKKFGPFFLFISRILECTKICMVFSISHFNSSPLQFILFFRAGNMLVFNSLTTSQFKN